MQLSTVASYEAEFLSIETQSPSSTTAGTVFHLQIGAAHKIYVWKSAQVLNVIAS